MMIYYLEGIRAMDRRPDARPTQRHAQPALNCVEPYAATTFRIFEQISLVLYLGITPESETSILTKWSLLA